jgi:K+-transporting ATPase KdpF subunit
MVNVFLMVPMLMTSQSGYLAGFVIFLLLMVYLVYSLFKPEKF